MLGAAGEEREVEKKREMGDRDGLISTSSSYSSKPASSSEARQDPACPRPGQAACLRAGLPPGAPGQSGGPKEKQLFRQRRKVYKVTNAQAKKKKIYSVKDKLHQHIV